MREYTLRRIVNNQYVFLERPNEVTGVTIRKEKINMKLEEGDIVYIHEIKGDYHIAVLETEAEGAYDKVNISLEKL